MSHSSSHQLVTLDLGTARKQLASVIEASIKKTVESVSAQAHKRHDLVEEANIKGVREQIYSNLTILLPKMKDVSTLSMTLNKNGDLAPQMFVVTVGATPNIRALVFEGPAATAKCTIQSKKSPTSAGALANLLKQTELLLATHLISDDDTFAKSPADDSSVKNPLFAHRGAFDSPLSDDSGYDSTNVPRNATVATNDDDDDDDNEDASSIETAYDPFVAPARVSDDDSIYF